MPEIFLLQDELLKKRLLNFDNNLMYGEFEERSNKYILRYGKKSYFEIRTHLVNFHIPISTTEYQNYTYDLILPELNMPKMKVIYVDNLIILKNYKFNEFLKLYYNSKNNELYVQINTKIKIYLKEIIQFLTKNIKKAHHCDLFQFDVDQHNYIYKIKFGTCNMKTERFIRSYNGCYNVRVCLKCNEIQMIDYNIYKSVKNEMETANHHARKGGIIFSK